MSRFWPWLSLLIAAAGAQGCGASANKQPAATDSTQDMARSHDQFLQSCMREPDLKDFCECGWGVYASDITPEEVKGGPIPPGKLHALEHRAYQTCAVKMPEEAVKRSFFAGCTRGNRAYEAYCACFWPELRGRFSKEQLADRSVLHTTAFHEARGAIAQQCSPNIPEGEVKRSFMEGCNGEGPQLERFCDCAWTKLREDMSAGELQMTARTDDPRFQAAQQKVHQGCDKLITLGRSR